MNAEVIVIGNEKGGSGKTTISMHILSYLLYSHGSVASIDLDCRQQSLSRFVENRKKFKEIKDPAIPISSHYVLPEKYKDDASALEDLVFEASKNHKTIIIDTPGSSSGASTHAHSMANAIITPLNDSFIDIDLIAQVNLNKIENSLPGIYTKMIWEQKLQRAKNHRSSVEWIVVRNRLSNIQAKNKLNVLKALRYLSKKFGFSVAKGFSERVIFKELFLYGLTLLDIINATSPVKLTASHISARQELRDLVKEITSIKYEDEI